MASACQMDDVVHIKELGDVIDDIKVDGIQVVECHNPVAHKNANERGSGSGIVGYIGTMFVLCRFEYLLSLVELVMIIRSMA